MGAKTVADAVRFGPSGGRRVAGQPTLSTMGMHTLGVIGQNFDHAALVHPPVGAPPKHPLLALGVALQPAEYLFLMVFLGFSVILGHFLRLAGGFTIAAVFALGLFRVPNEEALAMTLVVQASNLLSVAVVGALALWAQGI